eukprot:3939813-Rhodomonas_salina.1
MLVPKSRKVAEQHTLWQYRTRHSRRIGRRVGISSDSTPGQDRIWRRGLLWPYTFRTGHGRQMGRPIRRTVRTEAEMYATTVRQKTQPPYRAVAISHAVRGYVKPYAEEERGAEEERRGGRRGGEEERRRGGEEKQERRGREKERRRGVEEKKRKGAREQRRRGGEKRKRICGGGKEGTLRSFRGVMREGKE